MDLFSAASGASRKPFNGYWSKMARFHGNGMTEFQARNRASRAVPPKTGISS
jgi:hypothetical protein